MVLVHTIKIRLLAVFVVAFICLNAAGTACVAYCRSFDLTAAQSDHCPLERPAHHCDGSDESERKASIDVSTGEMDCCPMTLSFVGAPIEKGSYSFANPPAIVSTPTEFAFAGTFVRTVVPSTFNYRGPPPKDTRLLRIKNGILRI